MPNPALYQALETAARERISSHPLDVDRAVRIGLCHLRIRMLITYATGLAAASVLAIAAITAHFVLTAPTHPSADPVPTIAATTDTSTATTTPTTTETPSTTPNPTTTSGNIGAKPQTLAAIRVSPGEVTLARRSTEQLKATGTYSDGSSRDITNDVDWTSDDPGVAAVDRDGVVTSVDDGLGRHARRTEIRASIASRSASVAITVMPHNLTGITIDPPTIQSCAGSYTLAAKGSYSDGTTADLTDVQWATDNSDFTSVSQRGQLTIKIPRPNPTLNALPPPNVLAVVTATVAGQTGRAVVKCVRSQTSTTSTPPTSPSAPTTPPAAAPTLVPTTPTTPPRVATTVPLH